MTFLILNILFTISIRFLLLLLHLELMPIDNILMSFLHDIFKISALFYNILFYDFLSEITNMSFMPISSFRRACWWKIIFLFGTLKTVMIYMAQMIYNVVYFSLCVFVAVHIIILNSFAHWSFWFLYLELRKVNGALVHNFNNRICFPLIMHIFHFLLKNILKLIFEISIVVPSVFFVPLEHSINIFFKFYYFLGLIYSNSCQLFHTIVVLLT